MTEFLFICRLSTFEFSRWLLNHFHQTKVGSAASLERKDCQHECKYPYEKSRGWSLKQHMWFCGSTHLEFLWKHPDVGSIEISILLCGVWRDKLLLYFRGKVTFFCWQYSAAKSLFIVQKDINNTEPLQLFLFIFWKCLTGRGWLPLPWVFYRWLHEDFLESGCSWRPSTAFSEQGNLAFAMFHHFISFSAAGKS